MCTNCDRLDVAILDRSSKLFGSLVDQIFIRHLSEPAQQMLAAVPSRFKIAGSAERNGAGVTKHLPLPLRRLYCERGAFAVNWGAVYESTIDEIERQRLEDSDFGHGLPGRTPPPG
jgi:hypothetical protein